MTYISNGKNCFGWSVKDGIFTYELDFVAVIGLPVQINQHHFGINESQYAGLQLEKWMLRYLTNFNLFSEYLSLSTV